MAIPRSFLKLVDGKKLSFYVNLWHYSDVIIFKFFRKDKPSKKAFATLELIHVESNMWESHFPLDLPFKYQNKRFGIYFYSVVADFACQSGIKMVSSNRFSDLAERMWKSKTLRKFYNVKFRDGRFRISPKKMKKSIIKSIINVDQRHWGPCYIVYS